MTYQNLVKFYSWFIKGFIFVIPFLPFWISFSMFFPYITGRNFAFRILIELALILWIGLMIIDKRYRPRSNLILWAIVVFVIIVGIANFQGVDPYNSFWSRFERMEGYLMILHLFAYFLLITSILKTKKDWLIFFNLFIIAGLLVGGYAVLQLLGLKEAIQGGGVRVDGTIGNPTYLAVYLVLISGLALVLFFNSAKRWQKYFYFVALVFNFIILYFTASRGAAFALLVSIPAFLLLYILLVRGDGSKEKLFKKIAVAFLILIILVPLGFMLVKNTKFVQESDVLSRFAKLSFVERTVRARFYIWQMSWEGFKEKPILGWGQENYIQVFSKYYDPKMYDQEPWFDRPHNIILDWLINAGILGLASYLMLFVAFYILVINAWRENKINPKEGIILVVVPLAYFLQNLFVFDNFNTYVLFFSLLGYASFLGKSDELEIQQKTFPDFRKINLSVIIVGALLILITFVGYFINIKPIKAARGIIISLQSTVDRTDPFNKTLESFQKTLDYNTFGEREILEQLMRVTTTLMDQQVDKQIKVRFLNFVEPHLENYLKKFPYDIRVHLFAGSLFNSAVGIDQSYIFKAREHIKAGLELSPKKQQILYMLADNYLRTSELEKSMELMQKAIDLEPTNIEALANKGIIAVFIGRNNIVMEVVENMNKARLTAQPTEKDLAFGEFLLGLSRIGNAYISIGDRQNARAIFEQLILLRPDDKQFKKTLESL